MIILDIFKIIPIILFFDLILLFIPNINPTTDNGITKRFSKKDNTTDTIPIINEILSFLSTIIFSLTLELFELQHLNLFETV